LNMDKCEWELQEINTMGYTISYCKKTPDPGRIAAILQVPNPPQNLVQWQWGVLGHGQLLQRTFASISRRLPKIKSILSEATINNTLLEKGQLILDTDYSSNSSPSEL